MRRTPCCLFLACLMAAADSSAPGGAARLLYPTDNTALESRPSAFYMFTERTFEGNKSTPWQGGQYGFVRTPVRTKAGVLLTRFHEGLDIAPVRRDASGEPLDTVRSMADGRVVHANTVSGRSNYGRHVVVRHDFDSGPFYSLYAHLGSVAVTPGQNVSAGSPLGVLGYTGAGIHKKRAHVHVELNMLLHSGFERWHEKTQAGPNHHGIYNGINLVGVDVATILKSPGGVSIRKMLEETSPYYKVLVPNTGKMQLLQRYPWLSVVARAPACEIALSGSGIPLSVTPHMQKVAYPVVSWVRYSPTYHKFYTKDRLSGSGSSASLTRSGRQYIDLLTGAF